MHTLGSFRRRRVLAALASLTPALHAAAEPAALTLGILPNVSARLLAQQYQPMRQFLASHLNRPVQLATAPDFATFHARAVEGQYDFYITAANLGALALADGQAQALAFFEPGIPALALALKDRAQRDALAALRGHRLALSNPASLVALRGAEWLREKGLEEGRDYSIVAAPNEDSLARWLQSGDAPSALMSRGEFNQLSDPRRAALDVVAQFATVPGFLVMVPAHRPPADALALHQALQAFFASSALEPFTAATGVRALREAGRADLAALEPYLDATRRRMAASR